MTLLYTYVDDIPWYPSWMGFLFCNKIRYHLVARTEVMTLHQEAFRCRQQGAWVQIMEHVCRLMWNLLTLLYDVWIMYSVTSLVGVPVP